MKNIRSLEKDEIKSYFESIEEKSFRSKQLYKWLWQKLVGTFDEMSDFSKRLREELKVTFYIKYPDIVQKQVSKDGTIKYLMKLEDGSTVETVWIPDGKRKTICVSTQVGCAMGCKFCYTGRQGLKRDLKFYEIADQVSVIKRDLGISPTNIVMMGMGEPLQNIDNVLKAIDILNDEIGFGIAARKITVSTAGWLPGFDKLIDYPKQIKLAVSLNAPNNEIRDEIMPVNKRYKIEDLLSAVRHYIDVKKKRVTFEYVLIKGVNDSKEDADKLIALTNDIECKINLIPLNVAVDDKDSPFDSIEDGRVKQFEKWMMRGKRTVTVRKSKGRDINAACGELKRYEIDTKNIIIK